MSRSSSTAIEASATSASGLPPEDELGRPDGDRVTRAELGAFQPPAVDLGAVGRVEVDHPVGGALLPNLCEQGLLVALELRTVRGREIDRVLVRDVEPGDRDDAMVLHFLDELARELDRLNVCPESAPEDAFEQRFDLGFDVPEHGHSRAYPRTRV